MKKYIAAFGAGFIFAIGLGLSGMTKPKKVLGFLDIFGQWDPALIFVMGGAVLVFGVGFFISRKNLDQPILAPAFDLPTKQNITPRLVVGALLFGLGWGMAGFCPGPALVSLATLSVPVALFVGSMIVGMVVFHFVDKMLNKLAKPSM